jgi:1,4-alpha-glucan branching enzyme
MNLPDRVHRGVDARVGLTKERQMPPTPPNLPVPEHLASPKAAPVRRLPIGAELQSSGGVHFRVWAPRCREVVVEIKGLEPAALQSEPDGYFSRWSQPGQVGMRYRFFASIGAR